MLNCATWHRPGTSFVMAMVTVLGMATMAAAQETRSALRGIVVSPNGERIPYALVRVAPSSTHRFTDDRGTFAIEGLSPGVYRLEVRQLGFEPSDTELTIRQGDNSVRVSLRPIAIQLGAITVAAVDRCTRPGPPDPSTEPVLAAIFGQLRENAHRFAILADSYPFRYVMARSLYDLDELGNVVWSLSDTVEYRSDARLRYRPGDVLGWGPGPAGTRVRVLNLPTMPDLADSAFHANHCFAWGGMIEREGRSLVRVAFRAAEALRTSDIDGDVDLDPVTYQVRAAAIRLTRPGRALPGLLAASDSLTYEELYPNIVLLGAFRGSVVPVLGVRIRNRTARHVEEQRLVRVHFLRPLPTSDRAPQ